MRGTILLTLVLCLLPGLLAAEDGVLIRPRYQDHLTLRATWHLESENRFTPPFEGAEWGKMTTDFDFSLVAREVEEDGGCTFRLDGRRLKSEAQGPRGGIGIEATPDSARLLLGTHWTKPGPNTPLAGAKTLTLGPRFQVQGSSGLEPLALYFLPGVDARVFLTLLTAPEHSVEPGTSWEQSFQIPVPELGDEPLEVRVEFLANERVQDTDGDSLVLTVSAELALEDFSFVTGKGTRVHVSSGRYTVDGSVRWDLRNGVPQTVVARQELHATADRPQTKFESRAFSRLKLEVVEP